MFREVMHHVYATVDNSSLLSFWKFKIIPRTKTGNRTYSNDYPNNYIQKSTTAIVFNKNNSLIVQHYR
jgi:hypothetical protein